MSNAFRAGKMVPGVFWIAFSDGTNLETDSPRIGKVFRNGVFLDGQFVEWARPSLNVGQAVGERHFEPGSKGFGQ
jgi:hypothetical protein